MRTRRKLIAACTALVSAGVSSVWSQQPTSTAPAATTDSDVVELSPFSITAQQDGRYTSTEAASGGRVRINVFEAPQSVSVITRALIDDVSANRILDAAKYVSGVTESILPGGLDRTTVRGFQIDGTTVDGFSSGNQQANLDPIFAERLEVVKGPNAILSPSGVPGGTINIVTRKPEFRDFGYLSAQVGIYDSERAELDVNRVFGASKSFAIRVVAAYQNTDVYPDTPLKNTSIMPMVSWQSKTGARATLQFEYFDFNVQNYLGVPLDPSVGGGDDARILAGVPRDANYSDNDFRQDIRKEVRFLLTAPLGDDVNMRLAVRYADTATNFAQDIASVNATTQGGATNPLNGNYIPGFTFGPSPTYTPIPTGPFSYTFVRGGQEFSVTGPLFNVQNDYVHQFKNKYIDLQSLAGVAFNYQKRSEVNINNSKASIDYRNPVHSDFIPGAVNQRDVPINTSEQLYISEAAKFWDERIALNGSLSYNNFDYSIANKFPVAPTTAVPVPQQNFSGGIDTVLKSYGIVVKPISSIALYASHSEVASALAPNTTGAAPSVASGTGKMNLQSGIQKEYGVRYQGLNNKLMVTVAYFDIKQDNFTVPNPANLVVPAPNPLLPALLSNRKAKGWEFEFRANLTAQLSFIGNYTTFSNRDGNNVQFRGTAEKSGAGLLSYRFAKSGRLSGLSVFVGEEYMGRRPGDSAPGAITVTPATGDPYIVIPQPTFWVGAHFLTNAGATYKINQTWMVQVNVDNVFDKEYIAAAVNRANIIPGTPINARLKVTYSF